MKIKIFLIYDFYFCYFLMPIELNNQYISAMYSFVYLVYKVNISFGYIIINQSLLIYLFLIFYKSIKLWNINKLVI